LSGGRRVALNGGVHQTQTQINRCQMKRKQAHKRKRDTTARRQGVRRSHGYTSSEKCKEATHSERQETFHRGSCPHLTLGKGKTKDNRSTSGNSGSLRGEKAQPFSNIKKKTSLHIPRTRERKTKKAIDRGKKKRYRRGALKRACDQTRD